MGCNLQGLVGHGKESSFSPKGRGEPLERPELVCLDRMPQAATASVLHGTRCRQGGLSEGCCGRPVRSDGGLNQDSDCGGEGRWQSPCHLEIESM